MTLSIITHLFGSRADTTAISQLAEEKGLLLIEDCSQAWMGRIPDSQQKADVEMYSFGLIKTNTAVNGAVLRFKKKALCDRLRNLNHQLPQQSVSTFAGKLMKAFILKTLTLKTIYSIISKIADIVKIDLDQILSKMTRGFAGRDLLPMIRFRPCNPLLRLLSRKFNTFSDNQLNNRIMYAHEILGSLPAKMRIGAEAEIHSHWVLPIRVDSPVRWIESLRKYGFDATTKASRLIVCPSSSCKKTSEKHLSSIINSNVIFLPHYPKASNRNRAKLKKIITARALDR